MTTTSISCAPSAQTKHRPTLFAMIADRYRAMRERRKARQAVGDLRVLSNHTLKDIGLHRSEITSLVCLAQSDRRRGHAGN